MLPRDQKPFRQKQPEEMLEKYSLAIKRVAETLSIILRVYVPDLKEMKTCTPPGATGVESR